MTKIECLLIEKTKASEECLHNSYTLVKDTYQNQLKAISQTYPHYSLHDSSHSESILNNIVALFGLDILQQLSNIDLWLLVCAAFLHDSGMYLSGEEIKTIFKSREFLEYKKDIEENKEIKKYAERFEERDNQLFYKSKPLDSTGYVAARILLADYIRKKHSLRSRDFIINSQITLYSSAIPLRIIRLLGEICRVHTEPFDCVMNLPKIELGVNSEYCHPRYIACLLRIGDLLDIDNNRFQSDLFFSAPEIPEDSISHYKKHLGVSRLLVSPDSIEVTVECESYVDADVTNNWFSWIKKEIEDQSSRWNQIVPSQSFGVLPHSNSFVIELKDFDKIGNKEGIPTIEVDSQKSLEIIQGSGLYSETYQCIREILQNSVDALTYRCWIENRVAIDKCSSLLMFRKESLAQNYTVSVSTSCQSLDDNRNKWTIVVKDNGIGMDEEDILHLLHPGKENKRKRNIKNEMPTWFKPSGCFGIGFQSIFLITDQVDIQTRKIKSTKRYSISLHNPTKEGRGSVFVKSCDCLDLYDNEYGTSIQFSFIVDKIPKSYSYNYGQTTTLQVINKFDFVSNDSLDIAMAKIKDEIYEFAKHCHFSITLNNEDVPRMTTDDAEDWYYCPETGLEIKILSSCGYHRFVGNSVYFRNQLISKANFDDYFLPVSINIVGEDARNVVSLNRNELLSSYSQKLFSLVLRSVVALVNSNNEKILNRGIIQHISAFFKYHGIVSFDGDLKLNNPSILEEWKNLTVKVSNKETTISQLMLKEYKEVQFVRKENKGLDISDENNILRVASNYINFPFTRLLSLAFVDKLNMPQWCFEKGEIIEKLVSDNNGKYITDLNEWYKDRRQLNYRTMMPCNREFGELAIDLDSLQKKGVSVFDGTFDMIGISYPFMVCPFTINPFIANASINKEMEVTDELIDFVYNMKRKTVPRDRIRELYFSLKKQLEGEKEHEC